MSEHYGEIVEKVVRREGHSLTDIAKLMGVNRRSIYNWFLQQRLKPDTILRIGRAIKHDFSIEFPGLFVSDDFKVEAKIVSPQNIDNGQEVNTWMEKYIDLLERYNLLLTLSHQGLSASSPGKFNVLFVNAKSNEYRLDLKNAPSDLFLEKCKRAGYKIKCVNRGEIARDRDILHRSQPDLHSFNAE
jgi:hypothetical protein